MKVIFIDSVHPILNDRLTELGCDCSDYTNESREKIIADLHLFEGAVIRSKFKFTSDIFEKAPNLRFIARSGSGMENIDRIEAEKRNVICFNSPEGNRDAVAEHTLGMLLTLLNKIHTTDLEVRKGIWKREENRGIEIKNKTIGIMGCGVMGEAVAQRLSGFGCKIIGYDKYKSEINSKYINQVDLDTFKKETDILSLHFNYLEENHLFVDYEFLNSFHKNIYLINTSRGKNLSLEGLWKSIEDGKVKGACLDVLEHESTSFENVKFESLPESFQNLLKSDKVLFSPHVGGWTHESYVKLSTFLAEKIEKEFFS